MLLIMTSLNVFRVVNFYDKYGQDDVLIKETHLCVSVMDECKTRLNNCYQKEGKLCIDKERSYTCGCRKGYTKVDDYCARMLKHLDSENLVICNL